MFILFIILLLALLLIRTPVAFALSIAGILGMLFFLDGMAIFTQIPVIAYKTLDDFVIAAIPLYILMSSILLQGRVGTELFDLGNKWLGHTKGGLGMATILSCAVFASISGSSVATAVTIGAIAIPAMLQHNYSRENTLGAVAAGGTLGILIPPSIPMILFGAITGESVGKLFLSGIIPGLLLAILFAAYMTWNARHMPVQESISWSERFQALKGSIWSLLLPIIIIGGIYSGLFTPTEAAAVGTLYSLFITFCIYKTLRISDMPSILINTVKTTAMIFSLMIGAMLFGYVLTVLQVPQALLSYITEAELNRWIVFLGVNILLFILGCFLETVSILLITLPILYPLMKHLGFDLIWFNVMLLLNMELALITPPIGMNLFIIQGISPDSKFQQIITGVIPFIAIILLEMIVIAIFPQIATWLPTILR